MNAITAHPTPSLPGDARLRTLFISDLHLGYKGADIRALNALLAACEFEHLYLVGDVLDGWKLEKRWYWTQDYCDLFDTLMMLRRRRVQITLITGNHDEKLREMLPKLFRPLIQCRFGIRIEERCLHRTATGERLLVMHGDQFDGALRRGSSKMADRLWGWLTERGLVRAPKSAQRWSLRRAIARGSKGLAERHANALLRRVLQDGADGIVFGHSHIPFLEHRNGRTLANCGGWTRGEYGAHTAIVETTNGALELVRWPASARIDGADQTTNLRVQDPDAARLIRYISALWRPRAGRTERLPRPPAPAMSLPRPRASTSDTAPHPEVAA